MAYPLRCRLDWCELPPEYFTNVLAFLAGCEVLHFPRLELKLALKIAPRRVKQPQGLNMLEYFYFLWISHKQ